MARASGRPSYAGLAMNTVQEAPAPSAPAVSGTRAVLISEVAENPLNTRDLDLHPERIEELAVSMRVRGQLHSCAVVSREGFLKIFGEYEPHIGDATWVQVTGGRRRRALIRLGRPRIEVSIRENVASSRMAFLAATMQENTEREDLDKIEEARGLALMVAECGGVQARVAEEMGKSEGWVSQRLALLDLIEPLQLLVRLGQMSFRIARAVSAAPPEQQPARWEQLRPAADNDEGDGPGDPKGKPETVGDRPARPSPQATAVRRLGTTAPQIGYTLVEHLGRERALELAQWLLSSVGEPKSGS